MNENKPTPPNSVPEEDLSLHEDFAPIIAENGLIRQPKVPEDEILEGTLTRIDTLQDLIQIRRAEKEKTLPPQPVPQELAAEEPTQELPAAEHTFAISNEGSKPQLDLAESGVEKNKTSHPELDSGSLPHKKSQEESKILEDPTTTLPAVIPAVNTALVSVKKPKNRKKGLLTKKRKPKKQKKNAANVPPTDMPPVSGAEKGKYNRRWAWVVVVLCFLFLGEIVGVLPVERIPLLRNLAYAMGFSKDDTARMSFLRALLSWTDKTIGLPGNWSDDSSRASLFARGRAANGGAEGDDDNYATGLNARLARAGGQTSLIDINALQKLQREKGRPLDGVRGSVMPKAGQEEAQADPAQLRDGQVIVRTESTIVQGDVYFGSDAGAINRDLQDGYDSSKTLTKVKNPHISDGKPIDWLSNMAKKMMRATTSLAGVDRQVENTKVTWMSNVVDVGDEKEHRDLYHAWITSRMSKYTENNMLKKALADSSFLGADLPQTASNVLNFSGVQIDAESLNQDQEAWKEYLEFEKRCKEDMERGGGRQVNNAIQTFNSKFHNKGGTHKDPNYQLGFPKDCKMAETESYQEYENNLNAINSACHDAQTGYSSLGNTCRMDVGFLGKEGQCDNETIKTLKARRVVFKEACKECDTKTEKDENGNEVPVDPETCRKEVTASWKNAVEKTEDAVLAQIGGATDYFPQIVKDQDTEDDKHYGRNTIVDGMKENTNITGD